MEHLDAQTFFEKGQEIPMVDVRSPSEFEKGHIPGAISLPLFSNEERAAVGTAYKELGRLEAIQSGLGMVGPKIQKIAEEAQKIAKNGKILVHCWRGGMRSQKIALLFEMMGLECGLLEGGYKAFKTNSRKVFSKVKNLIIVSGATGSGKTDILFKLREMGEQTIDLEGLANHKGSAFGGIGLGEQPTTEQFHNHLFEAVHSLDRKKRTWVEGESMRIGKLFIPEEFWRIMNDSKLISISVPMEARVKRLVEDYGEMDPDEIKAAMERITEKFGGDKVRKAIEYVEKGEKGKVAEMLLEYYDRGYLHSRNKHKSRKPIFVTCESGDPADNARQLIELVS